MAQFVEAHLTGTQHYEKAYKRFSSIFSFGKKIILIPEPTNQYDANAIKVTNAKNGETIGYVDRYNAALITRNHAAIIKVKYEKAADGTPILKIKVDRKLVSVDDLDRQAAQQALQKYPELAHVQFGQDAPTFKRFCDAYAYGIPLNHKTGTTIAAAISAARKAEKPKREVNFEELGVIYEKVLLPNALAERYLLDEIKERHGEIRPGLTNSQAEAFIDYLNTWEGKCPSCKSRIDINMDECFSCGKSLKKLVVPMPDTGKPKKKRHGFGIGCLIILLLILFLIWLLGR